MEFKLLTNWLEITCKSLRDCHPERSRRVILRGKQLFSDPGIMNAFTRIHASAPLSMTEGGVYPELH